jgi:hypothetical protein
MSHQLINFNIPTSLKVSLDQIAKEKRLSRTAIINQLLESYCRTEMALAAHLKESKASLPFYRRMDDNDLALTPHLVDHENFDGGW